MVTLRVNGESRVVDVEADTPLLWALRDELHLTGTKYGCGVAQCGACTVHLDGQAVRSCVTPAIAAQGREVVTIEGVSGRVAQAVQDAWRRLDVVQCARAERRGSPDLVAAYRALARRQGRPARREGNPGRAVAGAARVIEAVYEFPYLAHAPMEPIDCAIHLTRDGCEVWAGSQVPTLDQQAVARILGLPPAKVRVHTLLAGGSSAGGPRRTATSPPRPRRS